MPEIVKPVAAHTVRMFDIFDLTGRPVTQVQTDGMTVTLHFGPHHRIETGYDAPVRVRRHVREEHVAVSTVDDGHVWYVEKARPY